MVTVLVVLLILLTLVCITAAVILGYSAHDAARAAVELHDIRRRRELSAFNFETKADARRVRYETRREFRRIDHPPTEGRS